MEKILNVDEESDNKTILVHGILGLSRDLLELYFENKKKTGGGDIECLEIDEEADEALIVYRDSAVADRVLEKGPHFTIGSQPLTVERPPKPDPHSVLVEGIPETVSPETLEMFFESKKRSSGGNIQNIKYEKGSGEAVISFKDVQVAKQVLSREKIQLAGSSLIVSPLKPRHSKKRNSDSDKVNPKVLYISGIPHNIDKDTLGLLLESKKYGGGDIETLDFNSEDQSAKVTYVNEEDAQRILERKTIQIHGAELTLSSVIESKKAVLARSTRCHKYDSFLKDVHTIQVLNVPPISKNHLKLALEKEAQGIVDSITFFSTKSPVVRFTEHAATVQVLQKKVVILEDVECPVIPLYTQIHDKSQGCMAVMVTGLNESISDDKLEMYFGNRRKSGGYDVRSVFRTENGEKAVITFESVQAVKNVLGMMKKKGHSIKSTALMVIEMEPLPPPPLIEEPAEPDKLIMVGVPPVSKTDVEAFLSEQRENENEHEKIIVIKRLLYALNKHALLIEFLTKPDYDAMLKVCVSLPLKDRMVSLQKVSFPRMIQVTSSCKLDKEDLELYFESKRSGGENITGEIKLFDEERCAVIEYDDHNVVRSVLQKMHKIGGVTVKVEAFYQSFGICPYNYDATQPWKNKPQPFKYNISDSYVGKFLLTNPKAEQLLSDIGDDNRFTVSEEKSTQSELNICYKGKSDGSILDKKSWENKCRRSIDKLCTSILSEKVHTLSGHFDGVLQEAERSIVEEEGILLDSCKDQSLIILTGWEPLVKPVIDKLKSYIQELEEKMMRQKQSEEEIVNCEQPTIDIIMSKYHENLLSRCPKLDVKFVAGGISLTGLPKEISTAKLFVYEEIIHKMKSAQWKGSQNKVNLLEKKEVESIIKSRFEEAKIVVTWDVNDSQLTLYSMSDKELLCGKDIIDKAIEERVIKIQKENVPALSCPAWIDLKKKFLNDFGAVFHLDDSVKNCNIRLVTTSDIFDIMLEEIQNCLDENTVLQQEVAVDRPVVELITRFHKDKLEAIRNDFQRSKVVINQTDERFLVKGTKYGLHPAKQALQKLCSGVVSTDYEVTQLGMKEFFHSERGKQAITALETSHKVVCVQQKDVAPSPSKQSSHKEQESVTLLYETRIKGGPIVKVLIGDLTKHRIDVIVNAANGKLKLSGGLARAILQAGGQVIQDECSSYMRNRMDLLPGEVFSSSSGSLPCKLIIHAVGPKWNDGTHGEENELFEAVFGSLEKAEEESMKSVAIPLISCGVFGYPLSEASRVICEAVRDYFQDSPSSGIEEVHLIDNRKEGGASFMKSAKSILDDTISQITTQSQDLSPAISTEPELATEASSSQSPVLPGNKPDTIQTKEGISVTLIRGSITDQQVDAVVNTSNNTLNLNNSGVSGVILQSAGPTIQEECTSKLPNKWKAGDIVVTSGGNLNIKSIFHGFCSPWNGDKAMKNLDRFVSNALKEAHNHHYASIAFPAIGTGNLQYPRDVTAKVMVEAIISYSVNNPNTTVKDVYIVLYPKDQQTIRAFEDHWKSMTAPRSSAHPKVRSLKHKQIAKPNDELSNLTHTTVEVGSDKCVAKVGLITVTVKIGDITKEGTDVIVNSTDAKFNKGQVFQAIENAGGTEIWQECNDILQNVGPLKDVAITGAGKLSCKKIIHVNAAVMGVDWEDLLLKTFKLAEDNGMKSLALPALGTGMMKKSGSEMSEIILKALDRFSSGNSSLNLKYVNVVLFQKTMFNEFQNHMSQIFKHRPRGIIQQIKGCLSRLGKGVSNYLSSASESNTPTELYRIYAMGSNALDKAITALDDLSKNEISRHVFDGDEEREIIANLSSTSTAEIQSLESKYKVNITIGKGVKLNRIIVEGLASSLVPCVADISKMLNKERKQKEEDKVKNMLYKQVHWLYLENERFQEYSIEINYIIETAYVSNETKATWEEEEGTFEVIFHDMKERKNQDSSTDTSVKRTIVGSGSSHAVPLPNTWSPVKPGGGCLMVPLNKSDVEYQTVAQKFTPGNIKSIHRIQNPVLYQIYAVRKSQMDQENGGLQNEKNLYHGTAKESLDNINNSGFNRSYCGKNATMFGNGVYFAVNPAYSAQTTYSPPDSNGNRYIYQAQVLVGKSCVGQRGLREPPYLNGSSGKRYDSVSDQAGSIFVIFHDAQAYPEYLITF